MYFHTLVIIKNLAAAAEQAAGDRRARRHAAATAILQLDLSALTVAESVLRTSVSAVIFVSNVQQTITSVQRHRRNRRTTTSKQSLPSTARRSFNHFSTECRTNTICKKKNAR